MNNNRLIILFLLQKIRQNKQGICPIRCRITFNKRRKEFSTGLFINPDYWKSKQQIAKPSSTESEYINTQLSLIKKEINQAFLFLKVNMEHFDVEDIYLKYKGVNTKKDKTLLEVFQSHNDKVEKLVGKEYVLPTLWKYIQAKSLLKEFILFKYQKNDYQFKDLDINFINAYEFYLKSEKNLAQSSTYKTIQRFKRIIKIGIAEGYIEHDPFIMYKNKNSKSKVTFLDYNELKKLQDYHFVQPRLTQVRHMFIFCCYTGLAYAEMNNLSTQHITIGFDKQKWIEMYRQKTKSKVNIPLLPKAIEILDKYNMVNSSEAVKLLPTISNQKFNSYLKEIADIVGIKKRLTHHMARKTFATTILLYNDVPIEIVSELLGHSSIKITQGHYAKVVQSKVSEHILKLSNKLEKS